MRIGIIGTNFVSDMFMSAVKYTKGHVVGVCSGKYENALKFKDKYNIDYAYKDYFEMFDDKKIDAVYVATPNVTHFEIVKYAIDYGYHVFCEKPFMVNDKQAKYIFELAKSKNIYVHDGIVPLYTENFKKLKDNLHKIGKIRRIIFSFEKYSSRYDAYLKGENPTTFKKELANGALMDLGVYLLSVLIALFDKPSDIISTSIKLETGVDGLSTMILKYKDFDAVLMCSKISTSFIKSEIQGEEGVITIDKISLMEGINLIKKDEVIKISNDEVSSFAYQINDFIQNIEEKNLESKCVKHDLSLKILEVLTKARIESGIIYDDE